MNIKKTNWSTFIILCFLFFILCFLIYLWQGIYLPRNRSGQEEMFLIEEGESVKEIAHNLENQNLIKDEIFFISYIFLSGDIKKLQAGEYLISSCQTIPEVTRKFVKGQTIKEKITIIEGWDIGDIAWYFENRGMFQAEEIFEIAGFPKADYSKTKDLPQPQDFSDQFSFLKDKPKNLGLEGYLFPDTYEINRGEGMEEIIQRMLRNFDKKLSLSLRQEINQQGKTIFEVIKMASLLEKEVKSFADKKLISGILWKRIESSIPLQVDATIIYITGKNTTKIPKQDLEIESPYNTYQYRGLPLGPICNPGLDSILAAIYPESSEFWYYLSSLNGETIFSKTLEEHNQAKYLYLLK